MMRKAVCQFPTIADVETIHAKSHRVEHFAFLRLILNDGDSILLSGPYDKDRLFRAIARAINAAAAEVVVEREIEEAGK